MAQSIVQDVKIVLCMKWGNKYPSSDVNRLHRMVRAYLSLPYRFVCLTDDPVGIDSQIEIFELPKLKLPNEIERGWKKLLLFQSPLFNVTGTALFLDLDIEIVDTIDDFFSFPGDFCIIRDWKKGWHGVGNSSVFRFEVGQHSGILDTYKRESILIAKRFRNEQEFISNSIRDLTFWPKEWCVSFKYDCIPIFPLNLFQTPKIPPNAKIIAFHGHPKVTEARNSYWTLRLNRCCKKTTWIV